MDRTNLCHTPNQSCSACCGVQNLKMDRKGRGDWLLENTNTITQMKEPDRASLLEYRYRKEKELRNLSIDPEIYICPFVGYIDAPKYRKTGCLIHPAGSPNPRIRSWEDPQNVSLYGTSICQSYDCIAKEEFGLLPPGSPFGASDELYWKTAPNHNLRRLVARIAGQEKIDPMNLEEAIAEELLNTDLPVTSFDMPLEYSCYSCEQLWGVLGTLLLPEGYLKKAFVITDEGARLGKKIRIKVQAGDARPLLSTPATSKP